MPMIIGDKPRSYWIRRLEAKLREEEEKWKDEEKTVPTRYPKGWERIGDSDEEDTLG